MPTPKNCPLAVVLAQRLRAERETLVTRWLERIADRVTLDPGQIFPTRDILDHVPLLVEGIADYMEDPAEEITADVPVVAKAMELGEMRYKQGFDVYQILKEYEILGGVLFDFLIRIVDTIDEPCTRGELLVCGHRLFRSVVVIQQYTTTRYLRLADDRVKEREDRLHGFNRAVTHELKNHIGSAASASSLLRDPAVKTDAAELDRLLSIVTTNVDKMNSTLEQMRELSRLDPQPSQTRNILFANAAAEVKRQLRDFAEDRGVTVELDGDLPDVEVPAAAFELALSNYLSNAIKYRDPDEDDPRVLVQAALTGHGPDRQIHVKVLDNGLGVPEAAREHLFERYYRAHPEPGNGEDGSGLGLSLVRDNIEALGGRTWAEFTEGGSLFGFSVPLPQEGASD